jgi:hypothetical protein
VDTVTVAPANDEYSRRLTERRAIVAHLDRTGLRISNLRLLAFGVGVVLLVLAWRGVASWWLLLIPLGALLLLIVYHDRVLRRRAAAARAIVFYERGIARLADRWIGTGEPGDRFKDDDHLYANDLDLFGRGSLFELLSVARTQSGEATLAGWLTSPASRDEVVARHGAVRELAAAIDLRESLFVAGSDVRAAVDGDALTAWAASPPIMRPRWMRAIAILLTAAVAGSVTWLVAADDPVPLEIVLVVQSLFGWAQHKRVERALHAADSPARELDVLSGLLEILERQTFVAPKLIAVRRRLDTQERAASTAIRRLHRLVEMHDWLHNVIFVPIGLVVQWGTHLAWAIETWRARHGHEVHQWIEAVAELEALASLAAWSYEHPDCPFPEIVDAPEATFEGDALGHPLLPSASVVRNDAHLVGGVRLLVVSGSNMSGKSTYLRTIGINAVMALAGAPVRATRLRLTPLAIGATLRIQDSLQEGRSRFYAEITRIRRLSAVAEQSLPMLFLLDELFHGTNSHDRVVGAAGVLRSLIDRGAIGLVTTHDLALTTVAEQLAPRAANVHFEDWFEAGQLQFDYRVKPGPVTHSNAIALMRAVGLDVADAEVADPEGTALRHQS